MAAAFAADRTPRKKAQIAITFDLEMSRHYPKRGMLEWDYQKGNLDDATKKYSVDAAELVSKLGGVIHFFLVGRVLEQASVDWLHRIVELKHPIGNHTYDHINVLAKTATDAQFRFKRSPWLVRDKEVNDVIRENIAVTTLAMQERIGVRPDGFRTPGGFSEGLASRPDIQQLLLDQGFKWVSSKYPRHKADVKGQPPGDDIFNDIVRAQQEAQPSTYASGLVEIPMSPISDVNAFRSRRWKLKEFLRAVRMSVEWAIKTGGVYDFLCHPSCMVVEDPKFETVRLICDVVKQAGDRAEIVGLSDIAARGRKPTSQRGK